MLDEINIGNFQLVSEVVCAGLRKLDDDGIKLQIIRDKLQTSEDSSLVDDFSGEVFIVELHKKYLK